MCFMQNYAEKRICYVMLCYMYVCTSVSICVYVCANEFMHIDVHMHLCICVREHVYVYVYGHACLDLCRSPPVMNLLVSISLKIIYKKEALIVFSTIITVNQ